VVNRCGESGILSSVIVTSDVSGVYVEHVGTIVGNEHLARETEYYPRSGDGLFKDDVINGSTWEHRMRAAIIHSHSFAA